MDKSRMVSRLIAIVALVASGQAVAAGLTSAIDALVTAEGTCLIAFHKNARPDVLHHTLEPAGRKHYLERYLDGLRMAGWEG